MQGYLLPARLGRSGRRQSALARDRTGGQRRRLLVDGAAQLLLELDERGHRRVRPQPAGDLEDLPQRLVASLLIAHQRRSLLLLLLLGVGTERPVERDGQELSVAERVADAVGG